MLLFQGDLTCSSGRENSFQKFRIDWNDEAAIFVYRQLGVMRNAHFVKHPVNKRRVVIGLEISPIRISFAFITFIRGKKKTWRPRRIIFPKAQIPFLGTVRSTNVARRPGKNSTERLIFPCINLFIFLIYFVLACTFQ